MAGIRANETAREDRSGQFRDVAPLECRQQAHGDLRGGRDLSERDIADESLPAEFLSDYGIRSLSKAHEAHPFEFDGRAVHYEPAEAVSKIKGGNSNWRGPIWFPTCFL